MKMITVWNKPLSLYSDTQCNYDEYDVIMKEKGRRREEKQAHDFQQRVIWITPTPTIPADVKEEAVFFLFSPIKQMKETIDYDNELSRLIDSYLCDSSKIFIFKQKTSDKKKKQK